MSDEDTRNDVPVQRDAIQDIKETAEAAGKTVVAAALAGAVATGAAAVTPDQIHLPDPTPIVQTIDQGVESPDSVVDDQAEKKTSPWKRILQLLKYALLALFFAAAFIFGVLQGCTACTGSLAAPMLSSASSGADASAQSASSDAGAAAASADAAASASASAAA